MTDTSKSKMVREQQSVNWFAKVYHHYWGYCSVCPHSTNSELIVSVYLKRTGYLSEQYQQAFYMIYKLFIILRTSTYFPHEMFKYLDMKHFCLLSLVGISSEMDNNQ